MRGRTHQHDVWQAVSALKAKQFGVFRADQAVAQGLSDDALHRAAQAGRLTRDLPRIYRDPSVPTSWEQKLMEAQLWAGDTAVVSHRSAAALHELWGFERGPIELTAAIARRAPKGITLHRGLLGGADVSSFGPFRTTSPTRTLIDLAAVADEEACEIALDSALRKGMTSLPYLQSRVAARGTRGRKGNGALTRLIAMRAEHPAGLESPLETKFLRLVRAGKLPLPQAGFEVSAYRVDFAYPTAKLGIELEGHEYHSGRKPWLHDVARRNFFSDMGWTILHFTWIDVTRRPRHVVTLIEKHLFPRLVT